MGSMESNMTKILEKKEELKKLEENKIIIDNENKININIDENNFENNNDKIIKHKKMERKGKEKQKSLKDQFDMKVYKNLDKILNVIFYHKNLKNEEIDNKNFEKLENECKNLFQKKQSPIEFCC